jgi:geranylgeranyl diphosphate synthase type II
MKSARESRIPSLAAFKPRIDRQLRLLFAEAVTNASDIDEGYARLLGQLQDQTLRSGKRLRPYIAYLAYSGSGGREPALFMPVAASLELLHQFLLVHDDIIDRDLVRYGGPNIAGNNMRQLTDIGLSPSEAYHYGSSFALLAGDAAWALANRAILGSKFSAARRLAVLETVGTMLFEVIGGQLMDVGNGVPGAVPASRERLLSISRYKTASYSFQGPLQVGALLAGASVSQQAKLREFGAAIGTAFQLADDILGIYGDEKALGKSVLSDLREGKQTLLLHYAYLRATPAQAETLRTIWGSRSAAEAELETVRKIMRATGAFDEVTALAEQHLADSLATLEASALSGAAKAELSRLAKFSVSRKY